MRSLKNLIILIFGRHNILLVRDWFWRRKYKALELKRREFFSDFVAKGDLCFDVGANLGNRIQPLLDLGAEVVAVEPQEVCIKFLKKKFGDKIQLISKGLDQQEGEKVFYHSDSHTLSSFSLNWLETLKKSRFNQNNWGAGKPIEMTTLDKLIQDYGMPKFIKIDVEGYELQVLKGLSHPIDIISLEYAVPEFSGLLEAYINQLVEINPEIEFNYSVSESMAWALPSWLTPEYFLEHINAQSFINTGFGDIYARKKIIRSPN